MDAIPVPAFVMSTTVVPLHKCAALAVFVARQGLIVIPLMENLAVVKLVKFVPKLQTSARARAIARVPMIIIVVLLVIRASPIRLVHLVVEPVEAVELELSLEPSPELELEFPLLLLSWFRPLANCLPLA